MIKEYGTYEMIYEEMSVFWEVIGMGYCERKSLYNHVSHSEWLRDRAV